MHRKSGKSTELYIFEYAQWEPAPAREIRDGLLTSVSE